MEHRSLELLDGNSIYDMSAYKTVNERGSMSANILKSGVDYSKAEPSSPLLPFHPSDPNDSQWQIDTQADRGINDILKHVQANDIWTNLNNGFDGISNEIETSLKNNYEPTTSQSSLLNGQTTHDNVRVKTTSRPRHEETGFTPSKRISWPSSDAPPAEPDPFVTVRSPLKVMKRPTWKTRRKKRLRRFKKPTKGKLLRPDGVRRKKRKFGGHHGKRTKRPKQIYPRGDRQGLNWKRIRPQKLLHLSSASAPVRTRSSGYLQGSARSSGYLPGSTSRSSSISQPDAMSRSLRPLVINGIFRVSTPPPFDESSDLTGLHCLILSSKLQHLALIQFTSTHQSFLSQGLIPLATLGLALSGSLTTNVQSSGEQPRDSLQDLDRAEAVFKSGIHTFSKKFL